ncbi:MAG: 3-(3-hydroxy-phenyl)propionate transporter MhpT [Alphaproteobacteria bacterium PA2]|nr:MAG: 3-(3-hydroxy-phenyl)propionate transporter MhpT [Alphaproteobacteria bacterium PA2]
MTAPSAAGSNPKSGIAVMTVALCWLVAICEGMDLQAAGVVAAKLASAFKLGPGPMGWFFSASTAGLLIGAVIGGRLADHFGRKRVLIGSVVVFGLLTAATAMSTTFPVLLTTRFLTGLGLGGALPNLIALVAEGSDPRQKNLAVSIMYSGMPLGGALVSLITLAPGFGASWTSVFYVAGIAPLVVVPLLIRFLPESRQFLEVRETKAPRSTFISALFHQGRAAPTLFLWASFFCTLLVLYLLLNWLPTLLVSRGLTKPEAARVQLFFNLIGAFAAMAAGWAIDTRYRLLGIVVTFLSLGAGLLLLIVVPTSPGSALLIGSLLGAAALASQSILYAVAPDCYPTEVRGRGVGAAVSAGRFGSIAGPIVAAQLLVGGRSPADVLQAMLPLVAVGFTCTLLLGWARGRQANSL